MSIITDHDFVENNAIRLPVTLCIDTSGSMGYGNKLSLLNSALADFYREIKGNNITKYGMDIAVIRFNTNVESTDFQNMRDAGAPRIDKVGGLTHLGGAVNRGLDLLDRRKAFYKKKGIQYYQPWLVILSDGRPEGEDEKVTKAAAKRSRSMESSRKLTVIPGYIGNSGRGDLAVLSTFSAVNDARKFDATQLVTFFRWLSASSQAVIASGSVADAPLISFSSFKPNVRSMGEIM